MKKIIIAIIVFVVVMTFTMPIFADPPESTLGELRKAQAQKEVGVVWHIQNQLKTLGVKLGPVIKAYLQDVCGIPPGHTP